MVTEASQFIFSLTSVFWMENRFNKKGICQILIKAYALFALL